MKIAVDLDDTISVVDRIKRASGYIERRGLPFRLVDPDAHTLEAVFDWGLPDVLEFVRAGGITVFTDAAARAGARETLAAFRAEGHEVTVLTSRTKEWFVNPEKVSRDWLEKRKIPYDRIVAEVKDKGKYCAENGICLLIDDNVENCLSAVRRGVYAVLMVGKNNAARAKEVAFGGVNWAQVGAQAERILSIARLEEFSRKTGGNTAFYAHIPAGELAEGVHACEERAAAFGRACRFRLTRLDREKDALLQSLGYPVVKTCTAFTLGKIPSYPRAAGFRVTDEPDAEWIRDYYAVERASGYRDESARFSAARGARVFASFSEDGRAVAVGYAVTEGDTVGLYCLRVLPEYRRKGIGTLLAERLLTEGKRLGAKNAYAQARSSNFPASELFRALGFLRDYDYWYREK